MNDYQIRTELRRLLDERFSGDFETLILDELGLRHGAARIDIAVVNGNLDGYEIKSDLDTLRRLPHQMKIYNSVLDHVTLVVGNRHIDRAGKIVPDWWGITLVERGKRGMPCFSEIRKPQENPSLDPLTITKLLWRDEALALLGEISIADGFRSKRRAVIYARLAEVVPLDLLRAKVRQQLKYRTDWRSGERRG